MIYIDLKSVAHYFNDHFVYILLAVLLVEFYLGVTNKLYANSIVELFLRLIGWTTLKTFRLRGKKLDKRYGVRNGHSKG